MTSRVTHVTNRRAVAAVLTGLAIATIVAVIVGWLP